MLGDFEAPELQRKGQPAHLTGPRARKAECMRLKYTALSTSSSEDCTSTLPNLMAMSKKRIPISRFASGEGREFLKKRVAMKTAQRQPIAAMINI